MVPPQDIGGKPEAGEMAQHCSYKTRVQFSAPVPGSSQPAVIPVLEDLTPFWILPELHSRAHNFPHPHTPYRAPHELLPPRRVNGAAHRAKTCVFIGKCGSRRTSLDKRECG